MFMASLDEKGGRDKGLWLVVKGRVGGGNAPSRVSMPLQQ